MNSFVINKNNELAKSFNTATNIDTNEFLPTEIKKEIQTSIELNPFLVKACDIIAYQQVQSATTSAVIYATPTDKDFYINSVQLSVVQPVGTIILGQAAVSIQINGVNNYVCAINLPASTASQQSIVMTFSRPIKTDRGSNILVWNILGASTITSATITGFTYDNNIYNLGNVSTSGNY